MPESGKLGDAEVFGLQPGELSDREAFGELSQARMTAINVFRSVEAVHIATDGLCYPADDKSFLAPKIHVAAHVPLLVAVRGLWSATYAYAQMLYRAFETFDELVAGIENEFTAMHSAFLQHARDPEDPMARNAKLILAGWSMARQRCEAYYIRGGDEHDDALGPPWRLIEIDGLAAGPVSSEEAAFDPDHIERDMVALMEAQRLEFPTVGGFCQLTTLTQHTVTQKILRRWY